MIVRFNVFDKKYRFEPFKVKDYRDLLLLRAELNDDENTMRDYLEFEFPDIDPEYRGLAFMRRYNASVGKDKIKMVSGCCNKEFFFDTATNHVSYIEYKIKDTNVKLKLKPIKYVDDFIEVLNKSLVSIITDKEYYWNDLSQIDKDNVLSIINLKDLEEIRELVVIKYSYTLRCCNKVNYITSFDELFKVLFDIDEIFNFYRLNRFLVKHGYSNNDLMEMLTVERSIALSIIYKEVSNV